MSFLFFIFTLLSTKLAGGHVEFNHVNISFFFFFLFSFSCNTNLEASHINIYISSVLYTILAIIQWVIIKKKKKKSLCTKWLNNVLFMSIPPTHPHFDSPGNTISNQLLTFLSIIFWFVHCVESKQTERTKTNWCMLKLISVYFLKTMY